MKSSSPKAGIYRIRVSRPLKEDRVYIGQATNLNYRLKVHAALLKRGRHHNGMLQNAYKKYGKDAFSYEVLVICPRDAKLLTILEQGILDYHLAAGPVYNMLIACVSSALGFQHSPETRKKMSLSSMGNTRAAGNIHTSETRSKIAVKATGRTHSQETRDLLSSMLKGRALLPETCAKMSASRMGMKRGPFSEEHKQKISATLKGRPITYVRDPPSEETRLKISNTLKGKPLSAETKLKMSISHRARLSALEGA